MNISIFSVLSISAFLVLSGVCYWQKTTIDDLTAEKNLLAANLEIQRNAAENLKQKIDEQNILVDQYKKNVSQFENEIQELNKKLTIVYPENERMEENKTCKEQIQWLREKSSQL